MHSVLRLLWDICASLAACLELTHKSNFDLADDVLKYTRKDTFFDGDHL